MESDDFYQNCLLHNNTKDNINAIEFHLIFFSQKLHVCMGNFCATKYICLPKWSGDKIWCDKFITDLVYS